MGRPPQRGQRPPFPLLPAPPPRPPSLPRPLQLDLVQADNYSWFGYPEDTVPSARNFLPGAGGGSDGGSGGGGGGGGGTASGTSAASSSSSSSSSSGTAHGPASSSTSSRAATSPAGAAAAEARQRMEALASRAGSGSRHLQQLVDRLTQELAAAAAQQVQTEGQGSRAADERAAGAGTQEQPAVVLMGLGGSSLPGQSTSGGQGAPGTSPVSSSDLRFDQQPGAGRGQELARDAPGSSGGSIFGGKLGWRRGAAAPAAGSERSGQAQAQDPAAAKQSRRQQQLAALNAMRLQAGRGYVLQQQQMREQSGSAATAATAAVPAPAADGSPGGTDTAAAGSMDASSSGSSTACATCDAGQPASEPQPADQRGSVTLPAAQQQEEPQHRKKRRKGGSLLVAGQQRQQQRVQAEASQQQVWALPQPGAAAPAAGAMLGSVSSVSGSMRGLPAVTLPAGSRAAALNRQLHPLAMRSGRLYSASRAGHPLLQTAARTAQAAQPAEVAAATSAAPVQAGEAGVTKAAAAAEVAPAVPPMSAAQRRAAVARINSLPSIVAEHYRGQEVAAGAAAAPGSEPASEPAAAGEQAEEAGAVGESPAARWINGLGTVEAPEALQPSARVSRAARRAFAPAVVDPATQRKKREHRCLS